MRYLAERHGVAVTRDELLRGVWGSDGTNVGGASLDKAISEIRKAIGDQEPFETIVTITGSGYRFAAVVERIMDSAQSMASLDPYATVPPWPVKFFERPDILDPLREKLVGERGIVGITAVEGMGGVGKTLITIALCHDPQVRQLFSDGIVWCTIGKEHRVQFGERVQFIAHALNIAYPSYSTAEYQSLLKDRSVLVVLDDVWGVTDVEPFRTPAGRSRLLYTSRNRDIAGPLGAENQDVGVLEPEQARRFLESWSGRQKNPPPEPFASEILDQCRGLALGLAMVGGALKGQPDSEWESTLDDLRNARLKEVGARPGGYAYQTLHAAIEVGVSALPLEDKERYSKLAILLEDFPAPLVLLQQLWGGDQRKVQRSMRLLVDRSLARRVGEAIQLHDFLLDYLREEYAYPSALALVRRSFLLSSHVIQKHPEEFGAQLTGRLLAFRDDPVIAIFLEQFRSTTPRPWLCPLWPSLTGPGWGTQRILEGHSDAIRAVAITPDGKRAISGSRDNTLRVWDLEGRQAPRVLEGHTNAIRAVAITADGTRAISGSEDRTLRVWDLEGQQAPRVLEGHTGQIDGVAITGDGRLAISGSQDKTLRIWDLKDQQAPRVLEGHTGGINGVGITADGRLAISGSDDDTLRVWDLEGPQAPRVLEGHTSTVMAVAITADGKWGISGSIDRTVRVWNLEGREAPRVLKGHTNSIRAVAITADGKWAISAADDTTLRVWDLVGQQAPRVLKSHGGRLRGVSITADGKRAIAGFDGKMLRVWNLEGQPAPRALEGHSGEIVVISITADGKRAITGADDDTLRIWDLEGQHAPRVLEGYRDSWLKTIAITADGKRAIAAVFGAVLRVWDLEGQQAPRDLNLTGYKGRIRAVVITADGRRAITELEGNKQLWLWDLDGQQEPRELKGHVGGTLKAPLAITPDGTRAIAGSYDNTLRVWDLEGQELPHVLEGHTNRIRTVAITADGKRALTGSNDNTLRVWDLEGREAPRVLEGYSNGVNAVAITADGKRAITGSNDNTLRVWDLERGRCLTQFTCDSPVSVCAAAGGRIVAGDVGGNLHVFVLEE
ncbi:MAG: winged helix-turn-helix domain-containing protein [Bryobacterales bacterium]|nr:winged helix-turn-helix domain-containing protein [Bryobacterales bacterium]